MEPKITRNLVVKGLMYIAEHHDASYEEIVEGLKDVGCTFSIDDVAQSIPIPNYVRNMLEGIMRADLYTGANIIANSTKRPANWSFVQDKLLKEDSKFSVYEYVRVATKDRTFTKEFIDQEVNTIKHRG